MVGNQVSGDDHIARENSDGAYIYNQASIGNLHRHRTSHMNSHHCDFSVLGKSFKFTNLAFCLVGPLQKSLCTNKNTQSGLKQSKITKVCHCLLSLFETSQSDPKSGSRNPELKKHSFDLKRKCTAPRTFQQPNSTKHPHVIPCQHTLGFSLRLTQ